MAESRPCVTRCGDGGRGRPVDARSPLFGELSTEAVDRTECAGRAVPVYVEASSCVSGSVSWLLQGRGPEPMQPHRAINQRGRQSRCLLHGCLLGRGPAVGHVG
jgi:hypothetical protein